MFSVKPAQDIALPSQKICQLLGSLIGSSMPLVKNTNPEIKQSLETFQKVFIDFSDFIKKEEINRPEFEIDYTLRKKQKLLQALVLNERNDYKNSCLTHDQKIIELDKKLDAAKEKILKAKLNNILDDLHEMITDEKLHLAIDERMDDLTDKIAEHSGSCKFFDCAGRNEIKAARRIVDDLEKKRAALDSKDPAILQKAVIAELETQQQEIEAKINQENQKRPLRPSARLSNEMDEVTAKIEGGEERHNSSMSRDAMFRVLRLYILYKFIFQKLSVSDAEIPAKEQLGKIFSESESKIESVAEKFWCPDSHNKKMKHFYKAFVNSSDVVQKKMLSGSVEFTDLMDKLLPVNPVKVAVSLKK
jgi:hypothetical protein